jgi:hypothetical protein
MLARLIYENFFFSPASSMRKHRGLESGVLVEIAAVSYEAYNLTGQSLANKKILIAWELK